MSCSRRPCWLCAWPRNLKLRHVLSNVNPSPLALVCLCMQGGGARSSPCWSIAEMRGLFTFGSKVKQKIGATRFEFCFTVHSLQPW